MLVRGRPLCAHWWCCPAVELAIERSSIHDKDAAIHGYKAAVEGKSNADARDIAKDILGEPVFFNWDCTYLRPFSSLSA